MSKFFEILLYELVFYCSSMDIPNEISDLFDNYHIDSLYRLCRFCFNRLSSQTIPKEAIRKLPTQLVVERANFIRYISR